jgi:osmotically inducible protein OsmC
VPGLSAEEFQKLAAEAKATCPVSRVLNAEISLEAKLEG